jgi:hypothetical protein
MRRAGAGAHYGFSTETLRRWAGDQDSLLLGAHLEGSIQAIILLLVAGRYAEYHIGASTERGRELTAWLLKEWHRKVALAGGSYFKPWQRYTTG